jgi:DMSO/TMAO reductase YedYZ molybdopterin-dependent catalytic subunit
MTPQTRRRSFVVAGGTLLVSFLAVGVFNAVYTAHAVQESDSRLCGVIAVSLRPRPTPPSNPANGPTTPYGRELAEYTRQQAEITQAGVRELRRLSDRIGCDK